MGTAAQQERGMFLKVVRDNRRFWKASGSEGSGDRVSPSGTVLKGARLSVGSFVPSERLHSVGFRPSLL